MKKLNAGLSRRSSSSFGPSRSRPSVAAISPLIRQVAATRPLRSLGGVLAAPLNDKRGHETPERGAGSSQPPLHVKVPAAVCAGRENDSAPIQSER